MTNLAIRNQKLEQLVSDVREIFQTFNLTISDETLSYKESGSSKYEVIFKLADFLDEFVFVGRIVYYMRTRPYKFKYDTILSYLDYSPVCIKNPNTRFLMRRHLLKLNSLLRFGSFSIDELGVMKFHLVWNFETNVHLAMRTKEDIEKWMKIGLATTMSTLKVNMTKLLLMAEIIDQGKYDFVVNSQPPNSIRLLPKFFNEDQVKLKDVIVDGIKYKVGAEGFKDPIQFDPLPPYPHLFYQYVRVSNIEYHGRLAVGGYAAIHVIRAKIKFLEPENAKQGEGKKKGSSKKDDKSGQDSNEKEKYFLVKVPRQRPENKQQDIEYVLAIAHGEYKEEDPRINIERTVIRHPKDKKFAHIARYYDDRPDGYERPLLYMENYMPQNLHDFNSTKDLGMGTKLSWLYQLAHVLIYLKQNDIVHVDLKPSNIVVAKNFFLKVIDFAESIIKGDPEFKNSKRATTMPFSAPETLDENQENIAYESDVFSFAHILYELLGGKKMIGFKKSSEAKVRAKYKKKAYKLLPIINWLHYLGPEYLMNYIYHLIMLCTTPDPTVRFPQEQLANFVKEYALFTEKLF